MNPLNISPAAQMFWGSVIRHLLTILGGALVTHGYVTQTGASAYAEELTGMALNSLVLLWANRVAYWGRVKMLIALMLPQHSTENDVNAHLALHADAGVAVPSVLTPPNTTPGVPK